ncbi:unnamed protein product [Schistosoma curassoni]|uniref:Uncharacterized protein n=1 Tax=Schistosoma curassoni TaxID=6186 RepID=A0A183KCU0_9TREM|nr:unnamed protein product [Schistosoma curassoni]
MLHRLLTSSHSTVPLKLTDYQMEKEMEADWTSVR